MCCEQHIRSKRIGFASASLEVCIAFVFKLHLNALNLPVVKFVLEIRVEGSETGELYVAIMSLLCRTTID